VDAEGRVDSLAIGTGEDIGSGGIPGCSRDEDVWPPVQGLKDTSTFLVTMFEFREASGGRYRFWMRPRRDQERVELLWSRLIDGKSCGSTVVVDKWKQGQWYLWEVEILPVSKSDTCGVKVGTLTEAPAPKVGK
jgi:hypothetical protein